MVRTAGVPPAFFLPAGAGFNVSFTRKQSPFFSSLSTFNF
jgi:hypothetical protein